jgi:zinc transport system permease protein
LESLLTTLTFWLDGGIDWLTTLAPAGTMWREDFIVRGCIAIVLVSLISGGVGSLVVCNRMAFFSDALAHSAFAGVAFALLVALILGVEDRDFRHSITAIMVGFGVLFGLLIAYVQEKSSLSSDTIIGVFFAGALGLGAIFSKAVKQKRYFDLDSFIFGSPMTVATVDLVWLMLLLILTVVFMVCCYNSLIFGSFNESLARSRRVPSRLSRYLFIVLLGVIVNLCQQTIGILLINGLLIVPAASASNLSNNLRQLLWRSIFLAVICGVGGLCVTVEINGLLYRQRLNIEIGVSGTILVLSVVFFALSLFLGRVAKRWGGASGI